MDAERSAVCDRCTQDRRVGYGKYRRYRIGKQLLDLPVGDFSGIAGTD